MYLDDFLVLGSTQEECLAAQTCLIHILRSLGFGISWEKCVSPTNCLTYLGVASNSLEMSVSVPPDKMDRRHSELNFFKAKKRATLKQIQRLCGILAHVSKVVKGGRTFSHRVISLLKHWPGKRNRIRLTKGFL